MVTELYTLWKSIISTLATFTLLIALFFLTFNLILYLVSLILSLKRRVYASPFGIITLKDTISVLIPLYKEKFDAIMNTAVSILQQEYPKRLIEVILITEPNDEMTFKNATKVARWLESNGIKTKVVKTNGSKNKAQALNAALRYVKGRVICVYDADDTFESMQFLKAISLINQGYHAVGTRVYRYRDSILGRFFLAETLVWFESMIPSIYNMIKIAPLSGEGLFIRKDVLWDIGGFPDSLAEDAMLTVILASKNYRIGFIDSHIIEKAPQTWKSWMYQRIRWFKGYLHVFKELVKLDIARKKKIALAYIFIMPMILALLMISLVFLSINSIINTLLGETVISALNGIFIKLFPQIIEFSAIFSYALVLLITFIGASVTTIGRRMREILPYLMAMPIYLLLLSFIALIAIITRSRKWYKTIR